MLGPEEDSDLQSEYTPSVSAATATNYPPSSAGNETVSEIYPEDSASYAARRPGSAYTGAAGESEGQSVLSLRSTAEAALYKVIHGRAFSSSSETYILPADDEEHARLDMQHFAISLMLDSLFPFPRLVKHVLREGQGRRPQILDVGTGSGRWAVDMATGYPWADVVAIDLVPPALIDKDNIPSNCRFEVDDANLSMKHYEGTFDLVHGRAIEVGLNDGEGFLYEMGRILRPGGVLLLITGDPQLWDENLEPIPFLQPGQPGFCYSQYLMGQSYIALWKRGCTSQNGSLWWKEWLEENPNFAEVHTHDFHMPLGPWKQGLREREVVAAKLYNEDIARIYVAWRRLLLEDGFPEEDVSMWIEESTKELKDQTIHAHTRYRCFAAVRSNIPFEERGMPAEVDLASRTYINGIDLHDHAQH